MLANGWRRPLNTAGRPGQLHGCVCQPQLAGDGVLDIEVDDATLEARRESWTAPTNDFQSGALGPYAQTVGPASKGAVTHPGAKSETHVYADI